MSRRLSNEVAVLVRQYTLVIERARDTKGFIGYTRELPTVFGAGQTRELCVEDTLRAQEKAVAIIQSHGKKAPSPLGADTKDAVLNVRISGATHHMLANIAVRRGTTISEVVRDAVDHGVDSLV
jgi:predicted RNase H-like HicB family nuclease